MIYIASLQYSPIYKSLSYALGNQLESNGYEVRYLFSKHYEWMLNNKEKEKVSFIGNSKDFKSIFFEVFNPENKKKISHLLEKEQPSHIYFQNFHPFLNYKLAQILKKNKTKIIQHIHEPYVEEKKVYQGTQQYWLYIFEYLQKKMVNIADTVIISSKESNRLFDIYYKKFSGSKIEIPLMYEDLKKDHINNNSKRKFINFLGPSVPAKNPKKFKEIVEYSNNYNLNNKFLLISRNKADFLKYNNLKNLEFFHKTKIKDEEIGNLMRNSQMTVTPYKTARQSSVVSTAYMQGTPVLATDINGLREVIKHEKTGYLVDEKASAEEWLEGILFIQENLIKLSQNSRNYFLENFSEENWPKYFEEVFN